MIQNKRPTFLLLAIAVFMPACSSMFYNAQFAPSVLSQTYSVRTSADKIELFRSQTPSNAFAEIGAVNACCSSDSNELINMLRKKASENGGDALLGLEVNATGGAAASVIRYKP